MEALDGVWQRATALEGSQRVSSGADETVVPCEKLCQSVETLTAREGEREIESKRECDKALEKD